MENVRFVKIQLKGVQVFSMSPPLLLCKFIQNAITKVAQTKSLIEQSGSKAIIEVDGGVNLETGKQLVDAGATALVAGSFVFGSGNPSETISKLKVL
mgnify:CR=1 FL=1